MVSSQRIPLEEGEEGEGDEGEEEEEDSVSWFPSCVLFLQMTGAGRASWFLQLLQQNMQCSEVSVTKLIALAFVWRRTMGQDFLHDRPRGVFFFFLLVSSSVTYD